MALFDPAQTELMPQPNDPVTGKPQPDQETVTQPAIVSDYAYGLDSHAASEGQRSLFDSSSDVITKGIPLTGLAIVNSFANTGIELANVFGADIDKWSIQNEVGTDTQSGQDLNAYYQEHQQGIEGAALIGGSLLPGLAGVKAFKAGTAALRAASAIAEGGEVSGIMARATGLLPSVYKASIMKEAEDTISNADSLFNLFAVDKVTAIKAYAAGFADQGLQSLAYELATAATMKASPITDDMNFSDMTQNIVSGALLGAGIGGLIEGLGTRAIFKQMAQGADDASKAQQLFNNVGIGGYEAGDRVNTIIHSLWNIPEAKTGLAGVFAGRTNAAGINAAKLALKDIVAPGDEALSSSLIDLAQRMKASGVSEDDAYNTFAKLAKIERVTNVISPEIDDGSFYISKRTSQSGLNPDNSNEWTSAKVNPNADISQRFQLRPGSYTTVRATAQDTFFDVNGNPQPLYKNSEDAFNQGVDLFRNAKGDIIVNPKAPNIVQVPAVGESRILTQKEAVALKTPSKPDANGVSTASLPEGSRPLLGSQVTIGDKPGATIVNFKTGSFTNSAVPTVGDHGNLQLKYNGLSYGEGKFSAQSIDSEITPDTPTIDASARYAWFEKRGIRQGDDIASSDIPAMETLYRQMGDGSLTDEALKKITVDGDEIGQRSNILEQLQDAKNNQLTEDISGGMNAEEAALRANVPQEYIGNNFKAPNGEADFINPPDYHSTLTHAQLWYDIGSLNLQDGNLLKGIRDTQYRVQQTTAANQDTATGFFGNDADNFKINGTASQAGLTKSPGSGFWSFSAAAYSSFSQELERVGRFLSNKTNKDIDKVQRVLAAPANALRQDKEAGAEAGMFIHARQSAPGQSFSWLSPELEQKYMGTQTGNVAVLTDALVKDEKGNIVDFSPGFIPKGFVDASKLDTPTQAGLRNYYSLSPKVADWERANQSLNDERVIHKNNFFASNGLTRKFPVGTLYTPPIDTSRYPFFALAKSIPGMGMADDSVGVITARSAQELQQKIAQLGDKYSVLTKTGDNSIKTLHDIRGDYDYDKNFADNRVNNSMARKGMLNDIFPVTDPDAIINRYVDWHSKQVIGLNRDYTELMNAQLFAELRGMGDRFSSTGMSKSGFVSSALDRQTENPYQAYINTALNISPKEQYKTWAFANEKLESLFSTAFDAARSGFQSAMAKVIPLEQASDLAEKYGLGRIYDNAVSPIKAYYGIANASPEGKALSQFVRGANGVMMTGVIRLDEYQNLIHALTTPMLAAVESQSVKSQLLKGLITTPLPGSQIQVPATAKLIFNAVKNFFNRDEIFAKYPWYQALEADKTSLGIQAAMNKELQLPGIQGSLSGLQGKLARAADLGAQLIGTNYVQAFNHFISTDIGRQIFEAQGFEGKDLLNQAMTFTNRVQGNYIAGQRPVAFQGPIGQAFGLFQTFSLNLLQNMLRYVEHGEAKTLGLLGGLQTTLFGMQGMPGFNFINTHLVGNASGNPSHADLYSGIASGLGAGKGTLGDYLLYGVTSNWLDANLYTRGDINPRNLTIFPANPLDIPSIKGGINIAENIYNTEERIRQGGGVGASLMLGLEHNGLNRPLAGLGQLFQGFTTNENGTLIGTTQGIGGWSDLFSIANFSRIMGARPLDEAAALGTLGRLGMYTAKDEARMNSIGMAAKTELYNNGELAPEKIDEFAQEAARTGVNAGKFNSTVARWTSQSNAATANKVFKDLRNPGSAQNAMIEMGGQQLPDYRNMGAISATVDQSGGSGS